LLSQKSLRLEFALKLLPVFASLVFSFSYLVYNLIESSIYGEIRTQMSAEAEQIASGAKQPAAEYTVSRLAESQKMGFVETQENGSHFYALYYPITPIAASAGETIVIKREIAQHRELLSRIEKIVLFANIISLALIPIIALIYSYFLAQPIGKLSQELARMDEHTISEVDTHKLPSEFVPLAKTLNRLLMRIHSHINYQRQLFIGVAHELKTPLAVIRARNDVTLLSERSIAKYEETLRLTNRTVDEMNRMTKTVLEIGRAEYAQFDPPESIDLVDFLQNKVHELALLASENNRRLLSGIEPSSLLIVIRPTLISHIVQNLFSNALKFTPEGKSIAIYGALKEGKYHLDVIDEGRGIEENFDPFAPFVGKGAQRGTGLGLYLAKNAAIALGGELSIRRRDDNRNGTIASFVFEPLLPEG
jgi:two-component system OmpR family sensor kinase